MFNRKRSMKVFLAIASAAVITATAFFGFLINPLQAQQKPSPKLTWVGASLWDLSEAEFNKVFLSKPYYAAAIFVSNFVYGGKFLTTQAENFFSLADTYGVDVILAIDMIDYKNDPDDDRTKAIMAKGYNTWQEALNAVCAHFSTNHPSLKYIGIYREFSTPNVDNLHEFFSIVRSYGLESFDWCDLPFALDENEVMLWRPRTAGAYPSRETKGIKEEVDGVTYYKGTDGGTGEEWAVERYPPYGLPIEDYLWSVMLSYGPSPQAFAVSFDWWDGTVWYDEEEIDRIFRLARQYMDENPTIPFKYIGIGCGSIHTRIDEVDPIGGYLAKYNIDQEGFRRRDIFGLKIGPQFHPDIINVIYNKAVEYGFQTFSTNPSPPTYTLNINSSPITDVSFTLDGLGHVTPLSATLNEGNYTVTMPESTVLGGASYSFKNWEDDSTNLSRIIDLASDMSITAYYEEALSPPTAHVLSVSSSPIKGISLTVNGTEYTTSWSGTLAEGTYSISMPSNVTVDGTTYDFVNWEDNSTYETRMINLTRDMSLTAYYEAASSHNPSTTEPVSVPELAPLLVVTSVGLVGYLVVRRIRREK